MALFAPQPLYDITEANVRLVNRYMFPFPHSELFYNILNLTRFYRHPKIPLKFNHINDFILFMVPVLDCRAIENMPNRIQNLAQPQAKVPVAIMYGDGEKFISAKARGKLFQQFGLEPKDLIQIDPKVDDLEVVSRDRARVKGYIIKGGGHFMYANFEKYTHQIVEDLLNYKN